MKHLRKKIRRAKLVLAWETLWPALFPLLLVSGLFVLAALAGVFEILPGIVHAVVLAVFFALFGLALRPLFTLRWPDESEALRLLERRSGAPHRPATSYADTLTGLRADPVSRRLWEHHRSRLERLLDGLRAGWPVSRLKERDPYAVRTLLALLLVVAFAWAGPEATRRLGQAFTPAGAETAPVWLDAWVKPPEYTGRAPVFLAGAQLAANVVRQDVIRVPAGSELVIRLSGAEAPAITFTRAGAAPGGDRTEEQVAAVNLLPERLDDGTREVRMSLVEPGRVEVQEAGKPLDAWSFAVIADAPPQIELVGDIDRTDDRALNFVYRASDDYGIADARVRFELADEQDGRTGIESSALLYIEPPDFRLSLPRVEPRKVEQEVYRDLTEHPWAGLSVRMILQARDRAGQAATSEPVTLVLPERRFTHPLAQAVIEQRKRLVLTPDERLSVARAIDALTLYPEGLIEASGVYLGLRTAYYRILRSHDEQQLEEVIDLLWELALSIEDGDLSIAERDLRAAQRALAQALAENAPQEEIKRLIDELRQALQRYMQALAEKAQRDLAEGRQMQPLDDSAQVIRPQDLARMLETIENLAAGGARDAAQQMLSQLQNLLENLRAGLQAPGMQGQDQEALSRMMEDLGELMRGQQQLMDETFQGLGEEQGNRDESGGEQLQEGLARRQGALEQMLSEMMRGMNRQGISPPRAFGQAGRSMRGAGDEIRRNSRDDAVARQGEALEQLREGARSLAQQMMQGQAGQSGTGPQGAGPGDQQYDPLGRPSRTTGTDLGLSTRVPTEMEMRRAREILEELRNRIGDRSRPQIELDYLDRLLRRF